MRTVGDRCDVVGYHIAKAIRSVYLESTFTRPFENEGAFGPQNCRDRLCDRFHHVSDDVGLERDLTDGRNSLLLHGTGPQLILDTTPTGYVDHRPLVHRTRFGGDQARRVADPQHRSIKSTHHGLVADNGLFMIEHGCQMLSIRRLDIEPVGIGTDQFVLGRRPEHLDQGVVDGEDRPVGGRSVESNRYALEVGSEVDLGTLELVLGIMKIGTIDHSDLDGKVVSVLDDVQGHVDPAALARDRPHPDICEFERLESRLCPLEVLHDVVPLFFTDQILEAASKKISFRTTQKGFCRTVSIYDATIDDDQECCRCHVHQTSVPHRSRFRSNVDSQGVSVDGAEYDVGTDDGAGPCKDQRDLTRRARLG